MKLAPPESFRWNLQTDEPQKLVSDILIKFTGFEVLGIWDENACFYPKGKQILHSKVSEFDRHLCHMDSTVAD